MKPWAELIRSLQNMENRSRKERGPLGGSKASSWKGETKTELSTNSCRETGLY